MPLCSGSGAAAEARRRPLTQRDAGQRRRSEQSSTPVPLQLSAGRTIRTVLKASGSEYSGVELGPGKEFYLLVISLD